MSCRRAAQNLAQKSKLKRLASAMAFAKTAASSSRSATSNMTTTRRMDGDARQHYQTAAFCAGTATAKKRTQWIGQKCKKLTAFAKKLLGLKGQAGRANTKKRLTARW